MPFKRISINQGRQPRTPLKGTISRWRSVRGDWWVKAGGVEGGGGGRGGRKKLSSPFTERRGRC